MDYTAQGDTMNLAARMQQMAAPGGSWVAEPTFRVAQEAFEWRALGPQVVKGKAEPLAVYDLRGRRSGPDRFAVVARRGLTPRVGRETELVQLLEGWAQAQQGHGQVLSIVGEAGLGKSRLLYECKQRLRQQGARCRATSCGESLGPPPLPAGGAALAGGLDSIAHLVHVGLEVWHVPGLIQKRRQVPNRGETSFFRRFDAFDQCFPAVPKHVVVHPRPVMPASVWTFTNR